MAPNVELSDARSRAQELLDQVDSPGEPLQLAGDDQITDVGWAWVYEWSTARWFATQDPDAVPPPGGGPIVVVKDSGDAWMLGSGPPYDEQLADYARENGYQHTVRFE